MPVHISYKKGSDVEGLELSETLIDTVAPDMSDNDQLGSVREHSKLLMTLMVMIRTGSTMAHATNFVTQNTQDIS